MKLKFPSPYILILCLLLSSYSTEGLVLPFLSIYVLLAWAWFSYFSLDNAFLLCVSSSILIFIRQLISLIYSLLQLKGNNILQYTVFGHILIFKRTNFIRWFHNFLLLWKATLILFTDLLFSGQHILWWVFSLGLFSYFLIVLSINFFFY